MDLVSLFLFILLISSGSVFAASYFNKRYEEVLPITCTAIIVVSFIFGLFGLLGYSTIVICLIGLVLFVLGIIKAIKSKDKNVLKNIFTPAFFVFVVLIGFAFLGVYHKVINSVDEYSHWGDIVKIMTILDVFGTDPKAYALFSSYPPAMSLFQYVLQEINCFISHVEFNEWLTYIGYDILAFAFVLPACAKFNKNKVFSYISYIILVITIPYAFYAYVYFSLYIDSFLSFLIAAGLVELLWHEKEDIWYELRMYSIMFTLTLAKDTGLLFAVLLLVGFVIKHLLVNKNNLLSKENVLPIVFGALSVALPKLLWSLNIKLNQAEKAFSNKIDFKNLFLVLIGKDDSYHSKVLKNYISELVTNGMQIGNTNCYVNYALLVVLTIAAVCIMMSLINRNNELDKTNCKITKGVAIATIIIFVIGMCIIYMYKFTEDEALGLASLDRYLNIVYFGEWLFIVISILIYANNYAKYRNVICWGLIAFVITCTSLEALVTFTSGAYTKASLAIREMYTPIVEKSKEYFDGDDKIWFINQYTDNEDGLAFNYLIRPNHVEGSWSIGVLDDENDTNTEEMTAEEWKKQLVEKDYDYVVLYDVNGKFRNNFADCFEDPNNIDDLQIYKVNKTTGMLTLCE